MTQRVFDVENEKDMADLWDILPDEVIKIKLSEGFVYYDGGDEKEYFEMSELLKIKWHDKTEIYRPIKEATKEDVGKLCKFWYRDNKDAVFGILEGIDEINDEDCGFAKFYCMKDGHDFYHCRRLTKQEIKELC